MNDSIGKITGNRWVILISRLVLGSIFIMASIGKIQDTSRFTDTVIDYGILPNFLAHAYGFILPWTELFIGCSLFLGIFIRFASLLSIPVILSFIGANIYSFMFDAPDICDCFGKLVTISHPVSLGIDMVMLLLAGQLLLHNRRAEFLSFGSLTHKLSIGSGQIKEFLFKKVSVFAVVVLAMALVATFASDIQGVIDPDSKSSQEIDFNYNITCSADPAEGGTVTLNPSGNTYMAGTEVTLTAVPGEGYVFAYWSGDLSGSSSAGSIIMNSDKGVTAHFSLTDLSYSLTCSVEPVGGGSVTFDPPGGAYDPDTQVTLTATPELGYEFDRWSGDLSGSANPVSITMNSNNVVTAHFTQVSVIYTLTVTVTLDSEGQAAGEVEISPTGPYESGAVVTLKAIPYSDNTFTGWEGDLSGPENPATVIMDSNKIIYAKIDCG